MLVKDFTPKYELIEAICSDETCSVVYDLKLMSLKQFKKKYGNRVIYSVRDFDTTCSTSIIYSKELS